MGDYVEIPALIETLLCRLESSGFAAFTVGGCVRDRLLGRTPTDWDICTAAKPQTVTRLFSDYTVIPTGIRHGTVTVIVSDMPVEITTFRRDGTYQDSRHPDSVTFSSDILEDLKRRDFTVSAMAYSKKRGLVDPFDGRSDLKKGLLRCLGRAEERFLEDALRILRAMRFAAVYGFSIELGTAAAMHTCRERLRRIAAERTLSELQKMLCGAHLGDIWEEYTDIFAVLFPRMDDPVFAGECGSRTSASHTLNTLPPDFALRLAGLFCLYRSSAEKDHLTACRKTLSDLRCSNALRRQVLPLLEMQKKPLPQGLAAVRTLVGQYGFDTADRLFTLQKGIAACGGDIGTLAAAEDGAALLEKIKRERLCCSIRELSINGRDLIFAGAVPGPSIQSLLSAALSAVIEDRVKNEKKALLDFLFCEMPLQFTS